MSVRKPSVRATVVAGFAGILALSVAGAEQSRAAAEDLTGLAHRLQAATAAL